LRRRGARPRRLGLGLRDGRDDDALLDLVRLGDRRARGRRAAPVVVVVVVLAAARALALAERVEDARVAVLVDLLVDQREVAVVQDLEPPVPRDLFQRLAAARAREVDAQRARLVLPGSARAGRPPIALLGPPADLVVIPAHLGGLIVCGLRHRLL